MVYLAILLCLPLYVTNSFCDKYVSAIGDGKKSFLYNILKFSLGSFILLPAFLIEKAPRFAPGAVICGLLCGAMYAISKMVILKGYEKSTVAFMTLCHSSGLILPCLLGHFVWGEGLGLLSIFGILLVILAMLFAKGVPKSQKKNSIAGILIGIVVFVASGGVMILQKLMGVYFFAQSISAYNFYSFVSAALILVCFEKPRVMKTAFCGKLLALSAASALSLCVISMVMTKLASSVPSVILFPLFNLSGIVLVTLMSALFFKERLTQKMIVGMILGMLGLFLLNL